MRLRATIAAVLAAMAVTPVAAAQAPPAQWANPVVAGDFPDPSIVRDGTTYWAYGTGDLFPVMRSDDLVTWTPAGNALAARPSWAIPDPDWHAWAPSVIRAGEQFVLFHTGLSDRLGVRTNCIGVATAPTPAGPFAERGILSDAAGAPVGCGDASGYGNIDPQPFVDDDGRAWLYMSTDWRCDAPGQCVLAPGISVVPLTPDLLQAAGPRTRVLEGVGGSWEQAPWAPVVENPAVVKVGATYHLLYSGGSWLAGYAMGEATAASPTGPFTRTSAEPILRSTPTVLDPGGGSVVTGPRGGQWLAYHARAASPLAPRSLRLDSLAPGPDGRLVVAGPTDTPRTDLP